MFVYIYDGKISFFGINATFYLLYFSSVQHKIRMKSSNVWQCKLHIGCQWLEYFCLWNPSKRYACMPKSPPCLITEKILQNKPCLLISSTPPNFFLKSTAIPFPILTSSLIQCAKEWEVGQENRSPLFSSNLKPCQTNITVVYFHSNITIVWFLYTFIKTINNSNICNMCGIIRKYWKHRPLGWHNFILIVKKIFYLPPL